MTLDVSKRGRLEREVRRFNIAEFEFRDSAADGFTFEGVASVVDTPYEVNDMFGTFSETIRSGAFNKTLRDSKADVALFVNHDTMGIPLATRGAGTLKLSADPNLRVSATLDPIRNDVIAIRSAVQRGEMSQMSIGFQVPKARDTWNADYTQREIGEVKLLETSIVWQGANQFTSTSMRSISDVIAAIEADQLSPAEIQRAIVYLDSLLPESMLEEPDEMEEEDDPSTGKLMTDSQMNAKTLTQVTVRSIDSVLAELNRDPLTPAELNIVAAHLMLMQSKKQTDLAGYYTQSLKVTDAELRRFYELQLSR